MVEDVENRERTERRKTRASFKRENAIAGIRAAHALSLRVSDEPELISEFLVAASGLDGLWSQFESEDNVILDCLIALDQSSEYSSALTTEVRAALNAAKAAATRLLPIHGSPARSFSLPGIPLPLFKGDLAEWPVFRDRFTVLVADHPDLCDIERFYYLLGCLTGSALDAIKNIPVSDDTYDLAWSTLTEHFDRPRRLASMIIDKLITAPVQSQESLDGLKDFLSVFSDQVTILESLNIPSLGDLILFALAIRCLPWTTRKGFEASNTTEFPAFSEVVAYVKTRVSLLETVAFSSIPKQRSQICEMPKASVFRYNLINPKVITDAVKARSETPSAEKCSFCSGNHSSDSCVEFIEMSLDERYAAVQNIKLCFRCLISTHSSAQCNVVKSCTKCPGDHHTLLHREMIPSGPASVTSATYLVSSTSMTTVVLLGTALVRVRDRAGGMQQVRALLDSGSQISAMTTSCVDRLGLEQSKWTAPLIGLSGISISSVSGSVDCLVTPRYADDPSIHLQAWIMSKIVANMPSQDLPTNLKGKFSHLVLADPQFDRSAPVDLLLGADAFSRIIDGKRVSIKDSLPMAYGSIFGWILIGAVSDKEYQSHTAVSLENLLHRFWQVEEPKDAPTTFTDGGQCESIYVEERYRDITGQFEVPSPFIPQFRNGTLSGLYQIAVRQLQYSERKLQNYEQLYTAYKQFMGEYELLEHVSATSEQGTYFIVHHPHFKFNCPSYKILVVFDDLAKSSSQISQNQRLSAVPKLQLDIVDIPTRFRIYQFELTADVYRMYRQILVIPKYRRFQHILWRSSSLDELNECQISTVTYRVNSAPLLALRVLKDIIEHERQKVFAVRTGFPRQTYVNNFYLNAVSVENVLALQYNLCITFNCADLVLEMWFYVWSAENPPDCASRGLLPSELELVGNTVYWFGSAFLKISSMTWYVPVPSFPVNQFLGINPMSLAVHLLPDIEWYSRMSSYLYTMNVAAWVRRFENVCQNQSYVNSFLSREELDELSMVARFSQSLWFPESELIFPQDYVGPQKSLRSIIKWRRSNKKGRYTNAYVVRSQGVNSSGR